MNVADSSFLALFNTIHADYTTAIIYLMLFVVDTSSFTILCTESASDTLVKIDRELNKLLTYACGTLLINDMRNVLISEKRTHL